MSQPIDPQAVAEDLRETMARREARIGELEAELSKLRVLQAHARNALMYFEAEIGGNLPGRASAPASETNGRAAYPPPDAFVEFSAVDAAVAILAHRGTPQSTERLAAEALVGGQRSTARDPKRNMFNILTRESASPKPRVVKVAPSTWGLPEWLKGGEG